MECCEMKGYLTYLILWNLSQTRMNGAQITREFEKRRGTKSGNNISCFKRIKNKGSNHS